MSGVEWYVGQEVILRSARGNDRTVTVSRVGRKWVYVSLWGREAAFDRETGFEKSAYSSVSQIGTPEMFAERDRRAKAEQRLQENTSGYGWKYGLSTEVMDAISDLIEANR